MIYGPNTEAVQSVIDRIPTSGRKLMSDQPLPREADDRGTLKKGVAVGRGPAPKYPPAKPPTPPIEPEAEPLTDREPTVNEVAMLATIDRLTRERDEAVDSEQRVTAHRDLLYERFAAAESRALAAEAERDRYREALESIANPYVHDAEAQTWIAQHALDGEG